MSGAIVVLLVIAMVGKSLGELTRHDHQVIVLGIARGDGSYLGVPKGVAQILAGDALTVYGDDAYIKAAFQRPPSAPPPPSPAQDTPAA